LYTINICSWVY